ncbi:G2 and S phase-expressed protein 1 isoform X2 [Festucalex cinctus]
MERRAGNDVIYLLDEKFDFDVSLSPDSSGCAKDEDDVFVDPPQHRSKCPPGSREDGTGTRSGWSPLSGAQLDAVCQEAASLARRLQRDPAPADPPPAGGERFIQDGATKLDALAAPSGPFSPVKRQTFLVQDSPMKDLPPAIRQRLRRGNVAPDRLGASSPVGGVKTRAALRAKAGLGAVLPSKPSGPRISASGSGQKTRAQPAGKVASTCKPTPSVDLAKSCEDLASDSASVASDVSDSSLNSSAVGKKRTLAPPTKVATRRSGVKLPPLASGKPAERRNTSSSSSSSVGSFNSSLSLSPATGKLNPSQNRALNSSVVPGNAGRPANQNRRRSGVVGGVTASAAGRRCSGNGAIPVQAIRKLSETAKAARTTPQCRTTPTTTTLDKATASSVRLQSGLKAKSKTAALGQTPTPAAGATGRGFYSPDVSKVFKPKRLMSVASMDSLHPKLPSVPLTPPAGVSKPLQLRSQRASGLPTPSKRRASAIPAPTPGSHAKISRPPRKPFASESDYPTRTCFSPAPTDSNRAEPVVVQPFCLEEEEPPAEPCQSESLEPSGLGQSESLEPSGLGQSESLEPSGLGQSESLEPSGLGQSESLEPSGLGQSESLEPSGLGQSESLEPSSLGQSEPSDDLIHTDDAKQEVLLMDLPAPTPTPHEKLLIDLSNTPDLIRNSTAKNCAAVELIDLSSPLIKWSPEDKKENDAPLINLSF